MPLAMFAVAVFIGGLYILCLTFPYLASRDDHTEWQSGHFVVVARRLGGEWLALWIMAACIATNIQIYVSSLLTASTTLHGMSDAGVLPRWLGLGWPQWRWLRWIVGDKEGVAVRSVLLCSFISILFGTLPLLINLSIESILYVLIMLMEVLCFLRAGGAAKSAVFPSLAGPFARKMLVVCPVVLAMWVLVVQNSFISFATYAVLALVAAWRIRPDISIEDLVRTPVEMPVELQKLDLDIRERADE
jgi:amino acid transporter